MMNDRDRRAAFAPVGYYVYPYSESLVAQIVKSAADFAAIDHALCKSKKMHYGNHSSIKCQMFLFTEKTP